MNINFELYKMFYYVCKHENITKAAEELMISQPGISKAIKNLENQLNCTLFIRNKNGVILTEEAKLLYEELKNAMEIIDDAEDRLRSAINLESGNLNIGVSKTIAENILLPVLKEFNELYPNININIHTDYPKVLINKVRSGIVDFLILNMPFEVPNDFNSEELMKVHDIFIATEKFSELKNKVINLEELNNYPLILQAHYSNMRSNIDNMASKLGFKFKPKMELASNTLVKKFALAGFGIGLVTKEYMNDENYFEVKTKPIINNRYIGILYLKNKTLNQSSKKFIELLKQKTNLKCSN